MSYHNTIFGQLLAFTPRDKFNQYVGQHNANKHTKKFDAWNQFAVLLYAQATKKDSLRDIETGLSVHANTWSHLGIKSVARSTIAYANSRRDYRIFERLFYALLEQCRTVTPSRSFTFTNPLYSLDATVINLCLHLFDWATYRKLKGALKLHTLLDNRSMMPEIIISSDGKKGDITAGKEMQLHTKLERGSIVVFDRAYIDYAWWNTLNESGIFFVSRVNKNTYIAVVGQHNTPKERGVLSDDRVLVGEYGGMKKYPHTLRCVRYMDAKTKKVYTYLTNNFNLSALEIACVYKDRWQIELFFKWIKQNLKIKTFLGTSENAVLTQIWIAMTYYLLLAYIKFQTRYTRSVLELTRMIRETILVRRNLIDLLSLTPKTIFRFIPPPRPQMSLF